MLLSIFLWANTNTTSQPIQTASIQSQGIWTSTREMTSAQNAAHHFKKHGAEMGYKAEADYIQAAIDFTSYPPEGTLQTKQTDGDTVFFLPTKGWFAIRTKEGRIRTFFERRENLKGYKSNMEYFNEQSRRR